MVEVVEVLRITVVKVVPVWWVHFVFVVDGFPCLDDDFKHSCEVVCVVPHVGVKDSGGAVQMFALDLFVEF